jgi:hypothetical protein
MSSHWVVGQPRKSREVVAIDGSMSRHGYLGVWRDTIFKRPYRIIRGCFNINRYFKDYNITFYS